MNESTSTGLAQEFFQLIKQFPRLKISSSLQDGLTRGEYHLLVMLLANQDTASQTLSVNEISSRLQISPSGVTHLINPLEDAGYIQRLSDRSDRRIVRIGLTDKGAQIAHLFISEVCGNLDRLIEYLGEQDTRTFICLMAKTLQFFNGQP
jgi:DNA-binding MarR family transcriptional regulator